MTKLSDFIQHPFIGYTKDTSFGSDFKWVGGLLYIDASNVQLGVSQSYVDGSLSARDASLNVLFNRLNKTDSSLMRLDGSVNLIASKITFTDASVLNLYSRVNYLDSCLGPTSILAFKTNASLSNYATNSSVNLAFATNVSIGISSTLAYANNVSIGNLYVFNTAEEASISNLYTRVNYVDSCLGWTSVLSAKSNASLGVINVSVNLLTTLVYKQDVSIGIATALNAAEEASISNLYSRVNYLDSCLGPTSILAFKTNASLGLFNPATINASIGAINVSLNLLTLLTYKQDVSIGIATALNAAEEASIANLYARVNYIDSCLGPTSVLTFSNNSSIGNLYVFNLSEEASIANLYARVNYIDSCLGPTSILAYKTNASLNSYQIVGNYIKDSSLSDDFYWIGGMLYVDVSSAGGVSKEYIDGSLSARDVSINWLNLNKANNASLYAYATNVSVNLAFASNVSLGILTVLSYASNASIGNLYVFNTAEEASISNLYARVNYIDSCLGPTSIIAFKTNASVGILNSSIANLYVFNSAQEASIANLYARVNYIDSCLGPTSMLAFKSNSSIGNLYVFNAAEEASIANLYDRVNYVDSCLGWTSILTAKSNASIGNLYRFNTAQEASIRNLYLFNTAQEASIKNLYERVNYVDSCLGITSELTFKANSSIGILSSSVNNLYDFNKSQESSIKNLYDRVNYVDSCLGWASILAAKTNASMGLFNPEVVSSSLNNLYAFNTAQEGSISNLYAFNAAQESSINFITGRFIRSASVGWGMYWNSSMFDVSLNQLSNIFAKNTSLNLYVLKSGDTMTGGLNVFGHLFVNGSTYLQNNLSVVGNTFIDGSLSVRGNFNVDGSVTFINTTTLNVSDNFIRLNTGLKGAPPITLQSGIIVTRGTSDPYVFVFDETDQTFRIGVVPSSTSEYFNDAFTQAVATRKDLMVNYALPWWNDDLNRFDTSTSLVWGKGGSELQIIGDASLSGKLTVISGADIRGLSLGTNDYVLAVSESAGGLVVTRLLGSMAFESSSNYQPAGSYIKDACFGSNFYWLNGILYVDVSTIAAGVTKEYVDGSLAARDVSIDWLNLNKQPIGDYIKSSSIGYGLVWDGSQLDVSVGSTGKDPSIDELYVYVNDISSHVGGVDYTSNLFINDGDNHASSLSNLDQIMGLIAPAKPDVLTAKDLSLGTTVPYSTVKYSAKLPKGLPSYWFTDNVSSGDTVTDYVVDATFRLYSASYNGTTAQFRAGLWQDVNTMGTLYATINGSDVATLVIPAIGVGNVSIYTTDVSGTLACSSVGGYGGSANNFWRKASAYIDVMRQKEGLVTYSLKHTESASTNTVKFRYDDGNSTPTFTSNASAANNTPVDVSLSGIVHFGLNSTFNVSCTAGSGIFYKGYHPTAVLQLTSTYGSTVTVNPGAVPSASDNFVTTNQLFTFNTASQSSGTAYGSIRATIQKPTGVTAVSDTSVYRRVNTYSQTRATTTVEYFTDESRRIKDGSSGTDSVWNVGDYVAFTQNASYAQVRNGTLTYPVSSDYGGTAFSGDKFYMRRFTKASAGSGTLTFAGFAPNTQLSPYGSGDVNAFIWLTDQGLFFDLGRAFGTGGGSGATLATGISAYSSLTASAINWTLGTYSTGNEVAHNGTFVFIMIFRNGNRTTTQITSS